MVKKNGLLHFVCLHFFKLSGHFPRRSFRAVRYTIEPGYNDIGIHYPSPKE